jgi:ssDNA-binding Zn-finger/Zn-ribbon topoisomerase 1
MKQKTDPAAAETAQTTDSQAVVHPRLVQPLPCPHCGSDAELKRYQHDTSRVYYGCSIPRCSYTYAADADALAAWNRRDLSWELEHSARYILEDANPEKLAEACGLPMGVIVAALENILPNAKGEVRRV